MEIAPEWLRSDPGNTGNRFGIIFQCESTFVEHIVWFETHILQNLINKNFGEISFEKILPEEKKLVSNYLYNQLCYHIEGFDRLKSFKVAKNILNDL